MMGALERFDWHCGCLGVTLFLLMVAAIWYTDRLARHEGRLAGMREAEQRNRQQQTFDYERGKIDGVRETALLLREKGIRIEQ